MKRFLVLAASLVMCAGVIAGCGSSNESDTAFDTSTNITVVSREDGSGTRGAFSEMFKIVEKAADGTTTDLTTEEAVIANKTGIVLSNVASDTYSIGYISLGSLDDSIKAVKINGVEATTENVVNGKYEIARPFNIATKGAASATAQDFMNYIMSTEGQAIVEENGYIKAISDTKAYEATDAKGKVVVSGSSSVSPVMEKLAEAYMAVNSNITVEIQTSDSTTGMQNAMEGSCDIGMASRELKDSELAVLTPSAIAIDGIAVIVNKENPIEDLTNDQVKAIFTGTTTTWSELE
ncbi:substrate-binding domain-containing protein [Parasporobacterium paucivorans]|uniref:Phosphate ABC transporter substrate-binding protein, PhoT family (TC 3.A.1.7.1) n=1 Tax=Parasporobacterium paucivorans DSM 15970 TaxID=1122934 RepID=A0A1M6LCA3_9FIRM|nr:substrate-binding domain-containing protein [Parasporobacterium paucivorans]SHJ68725.1 phosphate ABC transporter substrate-binding protein, PhoT family (TC 3.A.1.7.1) [Parasporobacterium paucivorans DSM 15970]